MKPLNYHDLLDAFSESGCPICRLLRADGDRFLDLFFHENVMDVEVQQGIRQARLMCTPHAWQMLTFRGHAADTAVLAEAVLDELLTRLDSVSFSTTALRALMGQRAGGAIADALEPTQPCLCCAHLDRMEHNYIYTVATHFGDDDLQEAYRVSEGLCLPHFQQFLRQLRDPALVKTAVEVQAHLWRILKDELTLFLHRVSANNDDNEPPGAEADSWRRAIGQIVGNEAIFGVRRGKKS